MKKLMSLVLATGLALALTFPPQAHARNILDAVFGTDGLLSVPLKIVGDVAGRGFKFFNSMLGGDYYRDYGDTGYRRGGYAYHYDYGNYGDGHNGYGYNHQGLDGNRFSGI